MSVNFSTITPMSQSTISRAPAYTTVAASAAPAASSPIDAGAQAPKKKSHWFRNTLIAAAIIVSGATLLRGKVDMFKNFDKAGELSKDAKFFEQLAHYAKKGVAVVGDFVMDYCNKGYKWFTGLFQKAPKAE